MYSTNAASGEAVENIDHGHKSTLEKTKDEMRKSSQAAMKEICQLSLPTEDDTNPKGVVILVVANTRDDTAGLVDFLSISLNGNGGWDRNDTAAGVRIHIHGSLVIVDTIPLRHMRDGRRSSSDIARRWISRNGLRRIVFGKRVVVVCVVLCRLVNTRKRIFSSEREGWMAVFSLIFKPLEKAVIILAKTWPKDELFMERREFLQANIIYSENDQDGHTKLGSLIKDSILPSSTSTKATVVPHTMCAAVDNLPRKMKFIWGAERVILLGRCGSGKSTLAQMLTLGKLDPYNQFSQTFCTSAGITGETAFPTGGSGRGWYVLDTPGFGEASSGKVTTKDAVKRVKKYVKMVEGTFAHYLYVVKKGRVDELDENIWRFLVLLFGEDIKEHFTVVVSDADDEWVEKEKDDLKNKFYGCENFLSAEFPPDEPEAPSIAMSRNKKINQIRKQIRNESLRLLEERLANRKLTDKEFKYGKVSEEHIRTEKHRTATDLRLEPSRSIKFRHRATNYYHNMHVFTSRSLARLNELVTELLEIDGRIVFPGL